MNKTDKIRDGHIQIDNKHNYRPLSEPMVKETHTKVLRLITDLQHENHNGNRNMRELNKLSVVHFKVLLNWHNSLPCWTQTVQRCILVRYIEAISSFKFLTARSLKEFSSMEQYVKGFQRFHTGEDVRPATSCKFLLQCFPDSALLCQWNNIRSQQTCSWAVHHCKKKSTFKWEQIEQHILNELTNNLFSWKILYFNKRFDKVPKSIISNFFIKTTQSSN